MRVNLYQSIAGMSLLAILACTGGGDSKAPLPDSGTAVMPSTTTPVFDPSTGKVPLPNILATATAATALVAWMSEVLVGAPAAADMDGDRRLEVAGVAASGLGRQHQLGKAQQDLLAHGRRLGRPAPLLEGLARHGGGAAQPGRPCHAGCTAAA